MLVRHNTALLEQAVELIVRRASIPLHQAEAEAARVHARATAQRRVFTGLAVAIAAVGLGLGSMLGFWTGLLSPLPHHWVSGGPKPSALADLSSPANSAPSPPIAASKNAPISPPPTTPPSEPTFNFEKFATTTTSLLGQSWSITAGHHFAKDTDQVWTTAWCYTEANVDGIKIKVDLAQRLAPEARPIALVASQETLAKAGLTDSAALALAAKCAWLDRAVFGPDQFALPPGRVPSPNHSTLLVGRTLQVHGPIDKQLVTALGSYKYDTLLIDSAGGSVVEALRAGEILRSSGKAVRTEQQCLSACVFVLAGGIVRTASENAAIGVHRFHASLPGSLEDGVEASQQLSSDILKYLDGMGVAQDLYHAMAAVPSDDIRYIDHGMLRDWRLLTPEQSSSPIPLHPPAPPPPSSAPIPASPLDLLVLGDTVLVQQRLQELGYLAGLADGIWGPLSRAALKSFRERSGLGSTDAWNPETQSALFSSVAQRASAPVTEALFGEGFHFPPPRGARLNPLNQPDATLIQTRLAAMGYYTEIGEGVWGAASRSALTDFKVGHSLPNNDIWDRATEEELLLGRAEPIQPAEPGYGNKRR